MSRPIVRIVAKNPEEQNYADQLTKVLNHSEEFQQEVEKRWKVEIEKMTHRLLYGSLSDVS